MQTHNLPDGRRMVAHDEREVLHRVETRGVVITSEQLIETWNGDVREDAQVVRKWTNLETGRLHHMDSVSP